MAIVTGINSASYKDFHLSLQACGVSELGLDACFFIG